MKKVLFKAVILTFVLVFGMIFLGCEEDSGGGSGGGGGEADTWINVTSLAQINGTWKGTISYTTDTHEGITYKQDFEITFIINASARTITFSQYFQKVTMSGFSNDQWTSYTAYLTEEPQTQTQTHTDEDGNSYTITSTVTIDNSKRTITYTSTQTMPTETVTDAEIASSGYQISKDGRRLRMTSDDPDAPFNEIIFYKQ